MHKVETTITIEAPAEKIWKVLLDLRAYSEWNPFLEYISGEPQLSQRLTLKFNPLKGKGYIFNPIVTQRVENRLFSWVGITFIKGIFDGAHSFELKPIDEQTTLVINQEIYKGLLSPIMTKFSFIKEAESGFAVMDQALKKRVDSLA